MSVCSDGIDGGVVKDGKLCKKCVVHLHLHLHLCSLMHRIVIWGEVLIIIIIIKCFSKNVSKAASSSQNKVKL